MKAYVGIEEKECNVRCEFVYGEGYVVSVRDAKTGYDVRGYLDQDVLDRIVQDWIITEAAEAYNKE